MNIKKCPCCSKLLTTKTVYKIGRNDIGLWLNCASCHSTVLLTVKKGAKHE